MITFILILFVLFSMLFLAGCDEEDDGSCDKERKDWQQKCDQYRRDAPGYVCGEEPKCG